MTDRPDTRKIVLITGASRGIGAAVARQLAPSCDLSLTATNAELLEEVAASCRKEGARVLTRAGDICDEEMVRSLANDTLAEFGRVDSVVNNAGIGAFKRVDEFTAGEFEHIWRVNVLGTFLVTRAVTPAMIAARKGQIINVASVAGLNGFRGGAAYASSKFAMVGFTESVREDLKQYGIAVTSVCPGGVRTGFGGRDIAQKQADSDYLLEPEDVARTIEYLVRESETANAKLIELKPRRRPERRE